MTFKDLDKKAIRPTETPDENVKPAHKSESETPHEKAASTDGEEAVSPAEDDDVFNNMPV